MRGVRIVCEVCQAPATHCCAGLDVPMLHFCEEHGKAHAVECPDIKEGNSQLVKMGEKP